MPWVSPCCVSAVPFLPPVSVLCCHRHCWPSPLTFPAGRLEPPTPVSHNCQVSHSPATRGLQGPPSPASATAVTPQTGPAPHPARPTLTSFVPAMPQVTAPSPLALTPSPCTAFQPLPLCSGWDPQGPGPFEGTAQRKGADHYPGYGGH